MTDDEILEHTGLKRDELRDLQQKVHNFVNSGQLNEAQKTAFRKCLKTPAQGAAELGEDTSEERLTKLLQDLAPEGGPLCMVSHVGRRHH